MIDEELLKPSRELMARLTAQIETMQAETAAKVERYKDSDDEGRYATKLWREFYRAVEPLRRQHDAVAKVIADYYGLQVVPTIIVYQQRDGGAKRRG